MISVFQPKRFSDLFSELENVSELPEVVQGAFLICIFIDYDFDEDKR